MKMTLLELVQDILNDMDSDSVNSISDTEESLQVAQIVRTTYYEMIGRRASWEHLNTLGTFTSLSDTTKPNYLKVPDNVGTVKKVLYNRRKVGETRNRWKEMIYLYPDEFLRKVMGRNSDETNIVQVTDFSGAALNIKNDLAPEFYTSFDDEYIVFDSYDVNIETTVTGAQSQVYYDKIPSWTVSDSFIPDLPDKIFPALLAEAKSSATLKLKEETDDKAEQQSVRQHKRMSLDGWRVNKQMRYPNYGRRAGKAPLSTRRNIFGERS